MVSVRANFIQNQNKVNLSEKQSPANIGEADLKNFEHPSMFFESGESLQARFQLQDITVLTPQGNPKLRLPPKLIEEVKDQPKESPKDIF